MGWAEVIRELKSLFTELPTSRFYALWLLVLLGFGLAFVWLIH
jgi:hypothetical protein